MNYEHTQNGTFLLEWEDGDRHINLEIGETTYSFYIVKEKEATVYGNGSISTDLWLALQKPNASSAAPNPQPNNQ